MFRLALALGKTIRELDGLSYSELLEWEAFFQEHPPQAEVIDWQLSTMLAMLGDLFSKPGVRSPSIRDWSIYERLHVKTAEEVAAEVKRSFGVGD